MRAPPTSFSRALSMRSTPVTGSSVTGSPNAVSGTHRAQTTCAHPGWPCSSSVGLYTPPVLGHKGQACHPRQEGWRIYDGWMGKVVCEGTRTAGCAYKATLAAWSACNRQQQIGVPAKTNVAAWEQLRGINVHSRPHSYHPQEAGFAPGTSPWFIWHDPAPPMAACAILAAPWVSKRHTA